MDCNSQCLDSSTNDIANELTIEQLKLSLDELLSTEETLPNKKQFDLRILLCFMCGGENNEVEMFFSQLSSRFSVLVTNQSGDLAFIVNTFLGRSNRKVKFQSIESFSLIFLFAKIEFIPVSFHSLFSVQLSDFDGFILFYDRERKAAMNTMT